MSNIVVEAVKLVNEGQQNVLVLEAQRIISLIQGERSSIRACNARIEEHRKSVKQLEASAVTIGSVMGDVQLASDGNPNTAIIIKAIEKANKDQADHVGIASANLVTDITSEERNIVAANKRIAELVEKLQKLEVSPVSVHDVTGK
jgi:hypothetical protein